MKVKVSVVQESPVFFDKQMTIDKISSLVHDLSEEAPQLIVFPESFIPGYPRGFSFGTVVGSRSNSGRELYEKYYENSISVNSKETRQLERIAKYSGAYLVIGVIERVENTGSLFCSMLYISPTSGLIGVHRKIKPTGQERVIWHEDDGSSLVTFDTPIGKLGGLICWENYMPLARMAMYQKGIEIYIAPKADARESWTSTMRHIALEGRCFVLGCNQYYEKSMYPEEHQSSSSTEKDVICEGGSIIVNPLGEILSGPLYGRSGVLTAELEMSTIIKSKLDFDVCGHYSRDDIFSLKISNQPPIKDDHNG